MYGKSELGKDLICYSISPKTFDKTILLVFAIHGYEDNYNKDGEVLVDTANQLVTYYKENVDLLKDTKLLIVPCANTDGLYDGYTNNGFGRCNSNGVDLNRDFDANHKVFENARNKTLSPFSASESRALRDLVIEYSPSVVIDFHGWLNYTIGDKEIADIFKEEVNLNHKTAFNNNCNGYFSYWAHTQGCKALLVEYKDENISIEKTINAVNRLVK